MSQKNVFTFAQSGFESSRRSAAQCMKTPPRILEFAAEADRKNLALLPDAHEKIEGLAEDIRVKEAAIEAALLLAAQSQARWADLAFLKHWTPLAWSLMWFGLSILTVAETALSATIMVGLDLTVFETWLVAAGCTVGATLGVKALAVAWRKQADDQHDNIPVPAKHRFAIWSGATAIVLILLGQMLARESYADQAQTAGSAGVTWMVAGGLTLLQCGLYGCAFFFLYMRLPNIRAQIAFENFNADRELVTRLHQERSKLAAPLNKAVFTLRANWAANQSLGLSLIFEYLQEMGNAEKVVNDFSVDSALFTPIPPWVQSSDQVRLDAVDAMVARGNSSQADLEKAATRREAVLLGTAYPPLKNTAKALQPLATSVTTLSSTTPSKTGESS